MRGGFAGELAAAERRLRACGLGGRAAYLALVRHMARRLEIPGALIPEGPDAPAAAGLGDLPIERGQDLFGLAYERFFPDLFKGRAGQYFTPRPLVHLAAALAEVGPGDRVLDPACGAGGFLVAAHGLGAAPSGVEIDPDLVALARINLALAGAPPAAVRRGDLFRLGGPRRWSVILANPPFSVPVRDPAALAGSELAAGRRQLASDQLFLEAAWRLLEDGGRLAAVLPWSLVANPSAAPLRDWVDRRFVRAAVVALPEGVFRPFGGTAARACLVLLRRRPADAARQLVARLRDPGYDTTRSALKPTGSEEPAALADFAAGRRPRAAVEATWVPAAGPWLPGSYLDRSSASPGRPSLTLGALIRPTGGTLDPSAEPDARFTEVDLADLDKRTGEVSGARLRRGSEFRAGQTKACFREGDLLFGRMRPYLNNVGVASRPRDGLPERMVGSGEWIPLRAERQPWFALLALRSPFVREQLKSTGGQTRPRARASELPDLEIPDPGEALRGRLDTLLGVLYRRRLEDRRALERIEALYAAWGRGELEDRALAGALDALERSISRE